MPKESEYGTKIRLLRILRAIIEQPKRYTKQELATNYAVHPDTITGDFEAFVNAGFEMDYDEKYRYFFIKDKPLKKASELLYFSEEERVLLYEAIDNLRTTPERQASLKQKLHSLYDYSRLGFANLRKPYLTKIDLLKQAKDEKKMVVLEEYHSSNSSQVSDRLVEPFHIAAEDDMLHAYEVEKKAIRHFRITRFVRVKPTDRHWEFESHHNVMNTDPFRIVTNQQVNIHLRLSVGARNELLERYPLTKKYIEQTSDPNFFDFQANVNHNFYGLFNFILGFYHLYIEVIAPDSLREHLRNEVEKMKF
ncbi:MAG TPA: WYL domain-containing protein [Saprospiraceae bacterium]|nr:WYL domain-containing protein [Saprospiraceae bacterium]